MADPVRNELRPGLLPGAADAVEDEGRRAPASVRPFQPADRDDGNVGTLGKFGLFETEKRPGGTDLLGRDLLGRKLS